MHTVLIIEDSQDLAEIMRLQLQVEGCEAHTVASRDDAWNFVQLHGAPDTIIMDWHMPGMNVEDFLFKLATLQPRLPRIVLATAAQDADAAARKFNIPEVLRKPFNPETLLHQVDGCK